MINPKKIIFPLLILILTATIILYRFPSLPQNLATDEVEFTKLALSLKDKAYMPYSTLATGHSTLYFYILLFFLRTFGITSFALRLTSVISGIFCGILFYAVVQKIMENESIAFLASFIFITSRWFFGFARFAFEPTFLLFLELLSTYFLFQYIDKSKQYFFLILSGIFTGFAYNSYTAGRIFFLLPLGYILIKTRKQLFYFLIPFIILIAPLQSYLLTHQDIRVYQLSFLSNEKLSIQQKIDFLGQNVTKTVSMFFINGDPNGKHNYPFKPSLNPILGIFFIIGFIMALKNGRKNLYSLFFILYSLFSILPTIFVYPWENPNMLRIYTVLPSVAYFSILPFVYISQLKKFGRKKIVLAGIVGLIIVSSFYELRTYFVYQAQVFKQSFEIKRKLNDVIHCANILECKD